MGDGAEVGLGISLGSAEGVWRMQGQVPSSWFPCDGQQWPQVWEEGGSREG